MTSSKHFDFRNSPLPLRKSAQVCVEGLSLIYDEAFSIVNEYDHQLHQCDEKLLTSCLGPNPPAYIYEGQQSKVVFAQFFVEVRDEGT